MAGADPQLRSARGVEHRGGVSRDVPKKTKHRRGSLSGVETFGRFYTGNNWFGVVVGLLNLECPQQDRADESEHGAHSEHIQSQGKVHGSASLVKMAHHSRNRRVAETDRAAKKRIICIARHARRECHWQPLDRALQMIVVPAHIAVQKLSAAAIRWRIRNWPQAIMQAECAQFAQPRH